MMDVFNIPNTNIINWVFTTNGTTNAWQTWQKPKNCKFVFMTVIGGGGGGGGGTSGVGNRAGGGGGGSSAVSKGFYNADALPDILYIQVGPGGSPGAANGNGGSGALSYVTVIPDTVTMNSILRSGAAAAGGGTSLGVAGAAGTIFAQTSGLVGYLGLFQAIAGQIGATGVSATIGSSITLAGITSGGAGGGGASNASGFAGGSIIGIGRVPTLPGGTADSTENGSPGYQPLIPNFNSSVNTDVFFTGGSGGAGGAIVNGTNGGPGAFGCGGAGGGAGATAGQGGRGGDGIVIITAW